MYKRNKEDSRRAENCEFCKHLQNGEFIKNYHFFFVLPNIFPYGPDHIMLLPKRHINSELELHQSEREEYFEINHHIITQYKKKHGSCFSFTRENTPKQSMFHLHKHYTPNDDFIGDVVRVPYNILSFEL